MPIYGEGYVMMCGCFDYKGQGNFKHLIKYALICIYFQKRNLNIG